MIALEEFEAQWLEEIEAGAPSTTKKGHRFAQKILRDWLELDSDTAEVIYCDGAGDGGIDAAVFIPHASEEDAEGDVWMLVQGKYGSAFKGADTLFTEANKVFETLEGKRENLSSLAGNVVVRIRQFLSQLGPKDRLEYVVATNRRLSRDDYDNLEAIRKIGQQKFGAHFHVEEVSIETIYNKLADSEDRSGAMLKVPLKTTIASAGGNLHVGATKLVDMFSFMQAYKSSCGDLDMLYDKNVRKFLGHRRKVNKGIEHTIEHCPERFGLYNNGITIVAEAVVAGENGTLVLSNPYVVNGCQTTRSIHLVLQQKLNAGGKGLGSPAHQQWLEKLGRAVVVTKIVVVGAEGEGLLTETTRFTNSQNAVSDKDFISLEANFRNWAPLFNSRYGVFLEIQRGAWEARRAWQKQNPLAQPQYESSTYAFDLLKIYAAGWLTAPGAALGSNSPFAPGGTWFTKISGLPEFGVEDLRSAYLLQQLADVYKFGRGSEKPSRGLTRFLFCMAVVDLVRYILLEQQLPSEYNDISQAIAKLHAADLLQEIGQEAVGMIDDYFLQGSEDSVFAEPGFNHEVRVFLMSEQLGKDDQHSPRLKMQMALAKRNFRRNAAIERIRQTFKAS
jgi:AIPR protein